MDIVGIAPVVIVLVIAALLMAVPITAAVFLISTVQRLSRTQKEMQARLDDLARKIEGR